MSFNVGVIVGSISSQSINKRLAVALARLAPKSLKLSTIDISKLPLYNHDLDSDYPAEARALKGAIEESDAILFVTPEYNRSVPGVLKNALDWTSRPWGQNSLDDIPTAVIGASIGAISSAAAQQHLRNILAFLNSPVMAQPEAFLQISEGLITDDGEVTNPSTADFLSGYMAAFENHIRRNLAK